MWNFIVVLTHKQTNEVLKYEGVCEIYLDMEYLSLSDCESYMIISDFDMADYEIKIEIHQD